MDNTTPLNAKFNGWLRLMRAHAKLSDAELARRLGINVEMLYRLDSDDPRPGVFNARTLDGMREALQLPAWLILQAVETGRPIEVFREADGLA